MQNLLSRFALATALGLSAALGHAQVVYDNGGPDHASGNNMGYALQAEDFTLSSAATLGTIQFWSLEGPAAYRNQISFQIRSDSGGAPGSVIMQGLATSVSRNALGPALGLTEFDNTFALATPLALGAGTYWLTLHNGDLGNFGDPNDFYWETAAALGGQTGGYEAFAANGPFSQNYQEHAFNISAVPELPPGVALTAGLGVLFCLRRRAADRKFEQ